jgi:hypothetical protein
MLPLTMGVRRVQAAVGSKRRQAICLCCDEAFLPVALFLACQIDKAVPGRDYDICLCSDVAISLPADFAARGFRLVRLTPPPASAALPSGRLAHSTYLRLWLADALGGDYDRLLYLDSDMFLLSGDPGDLFDVDLGGTPIGAVRDMQQWSDPLRHVGEFAALGLPALPYFNAGLMLIDTRLFLEHDLCGRALTLAQDHPQAVWHHDQSLLNGVLRGAFAELSPVWNWQWVGKRALFTDWAEVRLVHFVGHGKPWNEVSDRLPHRYRDAYVAFLNQHFPGCDLLRDSRSEGRGTLAGRIVTLGQHALSYRAFRRLIRRFPDPGRAAS